ncbi:MAG: hypothetical protein LBI72_13035 [Flavobacteriaceae bacterium]|jgi:hypothetical protein|nr:hypothetical protein [Flavobacteriaceae bacterium]
MENRNAFEDDGVEVSLITKKYLERIAYYAKIVSIGGGIVCAILVIMTVSLLLTGGVKEFFNEGTGFFVLGIPILFILLMYRLFHFSDRLTTAIVIKNSREMELPFKYLRDFFVLIALSVVLIVVFLIITGLYEEWLPLFLI